MWRANEDGNGNSSEQQSQSLSDRAGSSQQRFYDDNRIPDETWNSNEVYCAGALKKSLHGNDYQLKLLMLFASQGINCDVAFRLATEMDEAEKFDDLVFRYTDDQGYVKYRFLQAKHRQFLGEENKIKVSDLKSDKDNNDFSLQKYFLSYLKDIEKEEFQDGTPEDFIICTNADFDFEPSTTKKEYKETIDSKKIWKAYFSEKNDKSVLNLGGKRYQFNENRSIRTKIISELQPIFQNSLKRNKLNDDNIEKIEDFLNKLVFVVMPSGVILEQKIKEKIGNEFNLISEIVYTKFFKNMYDWMKHRIQSGEKGGGKAHFLTNEDVTKFLNEARHNIANLGLISSTLINKTEIEKLSLNFKDDIETVKEIKRYLSIKQILIVCSENSLLSKIKVHQMLTKNIMNIIFSDLKSLSSLLDSVADPIKAFSSKEKNYLIIENLFTLDEDAENLLIRFYQIVIGDHNKKFILIIQPVQKNSILQLFNDTNHVKIIEDNNNKLEDLTPNSIEKILETEIMIFGEKRKLASLTTDASKNDLYSAIDGDALTTLINSDSIIIGSKHKYDFDTYIEIPRTLTYQTKIDKKCLNEIKNDLFAISGIDEYTLLQLIPNEDQIREFVVKDQNKNKPIRFIRLNNFRDIKKDFNELCCDYKEHTIHLLENENGTLEWKQSHGPLFKLRKFVLQEAVKKQIQELTHSAIISAEAGMGKSTILTTYSLSKNSLWTIRINLKDYQTNIDNANFDDLSKIVDFISDIIETTTSKIPFIKNLLQCCLKQEGQVTLLLDGYDEIKDCSQEKVVQLLRTLRTTKGKVLITTRSSERSKLEDALEIFAYCLDAFDEKQQEKFLNEFWIKRLNVEESNPQKNKIYEFTKQLLNHFHDLNLMKKEGLVGVALQARMVAEFFQDKCKGYLEHSKFESYDFGIRNISDLYERFVEYQYERYLKEKIEISGMLRDDSRTLLTRSYTKAHSYLALKSLFTVDQIKTFLSKEKFIDKELQEIGIIKILKNNDTTDFIHLTYAEYFVADFLFNALRKEKNHSKYKAVDKFFRTQIFRDQNKVIRGFLTNKMEKESLSNKWELLENIDLLGKVKIIVNLRPLPNQPNLSGNILKKLHEEVETRITSNEHLRNGTYGSIGNTNFLPLVRRCSVNILSCYFNCSCKMVEHYFTEIIRQGSISSVSDVDRDNCIKIFIDEPAFRTLKQLLIKLETPSNNKEKYLKELTNFLIPKKNDELAKLRIINFTCYFLKIFYPTIFKDVESYISSAENNQNENAESIIDYLKGVHIMGIVNGQKLGEIDCYLGCGDGSILADIFFHSSVSLDSDTYSFIDKIYRDKDYRDIDTNGVLISRVLKILTPEISKMFMSGLDRNGKYGYLLQSVVLNLIYYILNRYEVEELPRINKLAFLKMLACFFDFELETNKECSFTSEQVKTTLKLVSDILKEQSQTAIRVLESINYLFILGKVGLKMIDTGESVLVLDPIGELQYELFSGEKCCDIKDIIELIKWKIKKEENDSISQKEFLNKYFEILELKKGNRKRKRSE